MVATRRENQLASDTATAFPRRVRVFYCMIVVVVGCRYLIIIYSCCSGRAALRPYRRPSGRRRKITVGIIIEHVLCYNIGNNRMGTVHTRHYMRVYRKI